MPNLGPNTDRCRSIPTNADQSKCFLIALHAIDSDGMQRFESLSMISSMSGRATVLVHRLCIGVL